MRPRVPGGRGLPRAAIYEFTVSGGRAGFDIATASHGTGLQGMAEPGSLRLAAPCSVGSAPGLGTTHQRQAACFRAGTAER